MKNNNEPKFIGKAKLTKQGQVTLPREARVALNIEEESIIYWYQVNNTLVVVKELVATKDLKVK
ncbi:MAG: AbrB/MazE/SpoVT family DNA-binding domain-containing protein [Nanoarchaeota archaeon]|nr:AbrB/MazE/SpoVT family DNA-binding domain-containing protein [Nanoarchaeota archaeon]